MNFIADMSKRRSRRQLAFTESPPPAVCAVCLDHHSHTSSPKEWKNQHAKEYMLSMDVSADSLVCRPCRHDVTRVLADAAYVPRWRKRSGESSNSYCCVRNCNQLSFAQASMCSSDELQSIQDIHFQSEPVPIPTSLCKSHYHVVYDALQTRHKHCRTCGRRLRQGNDRPCPQPHAIQAYLSEHTDFAGDIVRSDRVCLTCYKTHFKENKPISRDDDLKSL